MGREQATNVIWMAAWLAATAVLGCASPGAPPSTHPGAHHPTTSGASHANHTEHGARGHGEPASKMAMCPMKVPETVVSVVDTADGVTISLATSKDHVAELQRRAHHMAEMHGRHDESSGRCGMMGP